MIQNTLRTPIKLHAPAFLACAALSLLPLLPSRASALSLFAGLRLLSSPCTLVLLGLVCPPCCPVSWLVLICPVGVVCCLFCLVCLVLLCVVRPSFCFCWLRLTLYWTGTLVYFAFTCTTKALIYNCICVSVRRLDRFTCTVDFHRLTMSLL